MTFILVIGGFLFIIMVASVTATSYRFGQRNALKNLPRLLVILAPAFGISVIFLLFPHEWNYYLIYFLLPGVLLLSSFLMWFFSIKNSMKTGQAGDMLLEIRRSRTNLVTGIVSAVLGLFASISYLIQAYANYNTEAEKLFWYFSSAIFWFSSGLLLFSNMIKNWAIKERGIIAFGYFIPWEKIKFFQWQEDKRCLLTLSIKRWMPLWRTIHLPIPLEKREIIDEILARNLATKSKGQTAIS